MKKSKQNKVVAFSIADEANLPYFEKMKASFKHFHPNIPLEVVSGDLLKKTLAQDPYFFYRATPAVARDLFKDFDIVVKIDADSVVTGDLSPTWEEDFDVGVVNNANPREFKSHPVSVWNIHPLSYLNCGYVVMKSPIFVDHWWRLCTSPHFDYYQYREQDLLNIMVFYGMYKARFLDSSPNWHGLISKGYWPRIELREDKLVLPKNEEWPKDEDKTIKIIHWAGGNEPNKMNFDTHFKPEVAKWLKNLTQKTGD